jgi:hypothetical protein
MMSGQTGASTGMIPYSNSYDPICLRKNLVDICDDIVHLNLREIYYP